ncbi:hypothetical protein EPUS_00576 [Endocarpon pusillum Z07020]|uniref:SH3 domain-containing protein n=1 Tax=Endocarpon pusillum (strain Z07020 / HMAS-L-300199) TaxID=1263415 RepID=U1G2T0_ENDPU|nr:uncharacterized protein EPUS_00576 [Endocarpon pusillum Z07020]ERF71587.1 hypothetical protein EPUS_00576 [Endocarpon pusillum Z07020]
MTTLKPQLIRADTLDLQTQTSPSAKDHTRQPTHPSPVGLGPAAPHQIQSLRNAEQDALQEQMNSPLVAHHHDQGDFTEEPEFYDDQQDEAHDGLQPQDGQNAGQHVDDSGVDDSDIGDQGDDDGMDDDMMDKISSSPSIDDGKYPFSIVWPFRRDSIDLGVAHSSSSVPPDEPPSSSSPYVSPPEHYPINFRKVREKVPDSHHHGGYTGHTLDVSDTASPSSVENIVNANLARFQETDDVMDDSEEGLDLNDIDRYLVPLDDPLLNVDEEADSEFTEDGNADDLDWEDDEATVTEEADTSSDDDTGRFLFTNDSRFIDSGWGGECLREVEDIDFEFVYALHTFVATVEGQANATKGDTMVLLDDSNSYWWLVRVVKDGSIGYLPAEHIETPTERLARLNKHRNIDLSATMLGDNPEKSKNPLKKAMRRRNAKTVQFAAPQYYEPSDFDYSDDEEGIEGDPEQGDYDLGSNDQNVAQGEDVEGDGIAPTGIKTQQDGEIMDGIQTTNGADNSYEEKLNSPQKRGNSDEINPDERPEDPNARSRRGLVRNTDSFFKDDGVETKKISLTPRLLRGDSDLNIPGQQPDLKPKGSLETFDKVVSSESDKSSDEKKKKEKKGMLGGFFKRKDKKAKIQDNESEDGKKGSDELSRVSPQSKKSSESLTQDAKPVKGEKAPQRQTSKLQKQPRPHVSPKTSPSKENFQRPEQSPHPSMESTMSPSSQDSSSTPSTVRSPAAEQSRTQENISPRIGSPEARQDRAASPSQNNTIFSPLTDALQPAPVRSRSKDLDAQPKAVPAKQVKNRFDIEDMNSDEDATPTVEAEQVRHMPPTLVTPSLEQYQERLSESPIEVSPIEPSQNHKSSSGSRPPMLMVDTSDSERRSVSPVSPTLSSSPSLVEADAETPNGAEELTNPTASSPHADAHTPSTARSTPTWSDASLRTYMDNDDDIRDLLIIVHDKSNVVPAGPDHPITGHLFGAEKGRLAEMQLNLDSMLTNWLARKNQTRLSR